MIEKPSRHSLKNSYKSSTAQNLVLLGSSFIPFFVLWIAAYQALAFSYTLSLLCALLASAFLVRIFIIQHDCGHSALFNKRQFNDWLGRFCSVLTIVPYDEWKRFHNIHHATSGNLDKRGPGNVNTLTVDEFAALSATGQFFYRVYRNPYFLFIIAPILLFFILKRVPLDPPKNWVTERRGTWLTSIAIVLALLFMGAMLGYEAVLLVHIPILAFTS
ncbi:MAG: omega-6 fatty acid desaturase (delta-12 desaturase), partial [Alteromonadaceae bacterium]